MQIHGFNKTTLLDYPGIVAATVFTGACNFRCPFCQNADLVLKPENQPLIPEEEVLAHLIKRKGITKGLCISGGEPTLQKDLRDFIIKCKDIGLLIKLDTNGYRPDVLKSLVSEGLVDYVAMDIKSSPKEYSTVAGIPVDISKIRESVEFLINRTLPYEFRTTVVKDFHTKEVMKDIAEFICGADKYYLQGFEDSDRVIQSGLSAYSKQELCEFLTLFDNKVIHTELRGL